MKNEKPVEPKKDKAVLQVHRVVVTDDDDKTVKEFLERAGFKFINSISNNKIEATGSSPDKTIIFVYNEHHRGRDKPCELISVSSRLGQTIDGGYTAYAYAEGEHMHVCFVGHYHKDWEVICREANPEVKALYESHLLAKKILALKERIPKDLDETSERRGREGRPSMLRPYKEERTTGLTPEDLKNLKEF